jgi:hypothetical protein
MRTTTILGLAETIQRASARVFTWACLLASLASGVGCASGRRELAHEAARPNAAATSAAKPAAAGDTSGASGSSQGQQRDAGTRKRDDAGGPTKGFDVDVDGGEGCARAQFHATLKQLDMLILLDQSGSMTEDDDRWTPTTNAIKKFVASPEVAGMGVGLQYFPLGKSKSEKCDSGTYAALAVPMRALPENANALASSIDAHYFTKAECCSGDHDGTPTRPAMEGVIAALRSWLQAHADHSGVILLATDGEPSSVCDNNKIDNVSQVIAEAAKASPRIATYVVGIGHTDKLSQLAAAGDTGVSALIVDGTGVNTEAQLLSALGEIRGKALPCDFALPEGQSVDPFQVNVQRTQEGSDTMTLSNVTSKEACADTDKLAWYYDDPAHPTRIQLCPGTCETVTGETKTSLQIIVGCATVLL